MHTNKNQSNFTQREIAAAIQLWNWAAVSLLDIRHNLISPEEALRNYRLPASVFLYTSGSAEVQLNDIPYNVERFGLFHAGKGSLLTIQPHSDWLDYYMVLYKAGESPFHRREFSKLMKQINPFRQQYGFSPRNAIFISELLRNTFEKWKGPTPLNLFYGKSAFYQLVYAVYEELERSSVAIFEPDSIAMAKQYLDEHYSKEISIQELCGILGISYSWFYKSFKERTGISPQEYLIQVRLTAAKRWLQDSDMPMRMIAEACGFADERSFYRLFAKRFGASPNTYRQNSPLSCEDNTIGNVLPFPYNWESQVSLDQLEDKGANLMLKQIRSKTVVAAALSLMLLLSACGTAPTNNDDRGSTPASSVTSQVSETEKSTRTIRTVMGDVEVPVKPQRVIATYGIGDVIALGITPIATYNAKGAAFEKEVAELPVWESFKAEEIMSYDPDLILVVDQDQYDEVSKIAPTVLVPFTELSMEERVSFLGEVLNKQDEAKKALSDYTVKLEKAKNELETTGIGTQTFSLFEGNSSGIWVFGDKWGRGGDIIYNHLGLKALPVIQNEIIGKDQYRQISMEVVRDYAGDYIIFSDEMGDLPDNAVWNALPAVKNGKVIAIDGDLFYNIDIYSSSVQLDYLMSQLTKK